MMPEEKELLLKDLSARLWSGVIVNVHYKDGEGWKAEDRKLLGIYEDGQVYIDCVYTNIENIKPYLRPMSSMTEEEKTDLEAYSKQELDKYADAVLNYADKDTVRYSQIALIYKDIDWYNKKHFDYRGLIPIGLALEAPEDMYN